MMPPDLTPTDLASINASKYSHVIVCFFHLEEGPKLVLNGGPDNDPYTPRFAPLWQAYQHMAWPTGHKTMMISVGGWGSGTWFYAEGKEEAGAREIAKFVRQFNFAGVDLNFEGEPEYRNDPRWLRVVGKVAVYLRAILDDRIVTIAPMLDNVGTQVKAINSAQQGFNGLTWQHTLTWINAQFYTFSKETAQPARRPVAAYNALLADNFHNQCPMVQPDHLVMGLPLESPTGTAKHTAATFNENELSVGYDATSQLFGQWSNYAGTFVWNWEATRFPPDLNWGFAIAEALGR
jgi:GH18 family chitinase